MVMLLASDDDVIPSVISSAVIGVVSEIVGRTRGFDGGGGEPIHEERLNDADEKQQVDSSFVTAGVIGRVHFRQNGDPQSLGWDGMG